MKLIKSFNPMTRLISWMIKPLLPIRLFATNDGDGEGYTWTADWYNEDEDYGGYMGTDGVWHSGDDTENYDWSNWDEVETDDDGNIVGWADDFGEVQVDTDENGHVTGISYRDDDGNWVNTGLKGYQEAYGMVSSGAAGDAASVFGASMTPQTAAALSGMNEMDRSTMLNNAMRGDPASLASIAAFTGTAPDRDQLPQFTDEQYTMAMLFAGEMSQNMSEGMSAKKAWDAASAKYGDPYGTSARDQYLKDAVINTAFMAAGPLISAGLAARGVSGASALAHAANQGALKNFISSPAGRAFTQIANKVMNAGARVGGRTVTNVAAVADALNELKTAGLTVAQVATQLGITVTEAKDLYNGLEQAKKMESESSEMPTETRATAEKNPTTAATKTTEVAPKAETKVEKTPEDTSKAAGITFKPTYTGGVSLPTNVGVNWLEVERGREKEPEKAEPEVEGFDSESGDDTLETTTQDAPTGGVGTDTFTNTNTDQGKKGWGLGEEDPNRANYDVDKWNRGMERVSTDVVSDATCKDFITKTFKDDPVLIKTVKIMKSKK